MRRSAACLGPTKIASFGKADAILLVAAGTTEDSTTLVWGPRSFRKVETFREAVGIRTGFPRRSALAFVNFVNELLISMRRYESINGGAGKCGALLY